MFTPHEIHLVTSPNPMPPPDALKVFGLVDREMGGVAIGDTSQGLSSHLWTCEVVGNSVMLSVDGGAQALLFSRPGIVDVALAFTQNMQPTVAWQQQDGTLWMRFYDGAQADYVVESFGPGNSPRLALDDKRPEFSTGSDVMLAYMVGTTLKQRLQRDRFSIERDLLTGIPEGSRLQRIGMANLRMQFVVGIPQEG